MSLFPTKPLARLKNYRQDGPFWSKRWCRTFVPDTSGLSATLPADATALTKAEDPHWRNNWKEILLVKLGPLEPFRPVIISASGKRYTTIRPVVTRLYTMRVGPEPLSVYIRSVSNRFTPTCIYEFAGLKQPLVFDRAAMTAFITDQAQSVTRV